MKNLIKMSLRALSFVTIACVIMSTVNFLWISADNTKNEELMADVQISLAGEKDGDNFNVYYGEKADTEGLEAAEFSDKFELKSNYIQHNFDTSKVTDMWAQCDSFITTALYNGAKYRNFEMSFTCIGDQASNAYLWPILVFGVTDPTKWVTQEGGGIECFTYPEGSIAYKGYIDGELVSFSDGQNRRDGDAFNNRLENGYHQDNAADWYIYKIRVENNIATFTVDPAYRWESQWQDEDWSFSYTFDLGNSYTGGYVGFASTGQLCKFKDFKITDLGGEVLPPPEKYKNSLENAEDMLDFDCYYADDVKNGMVKQEKYTDYWEHPGQNGVWRTDESTHRVEWDTEKYVSSLVLNTRQYKNFELTVNISRKESGGYGYMFPMVAFGVETPEAFVTSEGGGTAVLATAEGALCAWSATHDMSGSEAPASGYIREGQHTLRLSVAFGMATVSLVGASGETLPESYSFMLPETYTGGYIALVGMANVCGFSDLSVTELIDADVKSITISEITRPATVETGTAVLGEDLTLPEEVSVKCSDGEEYDLPVTWNLENYDRFTRGEYEITGSLQSIFVDSNRKKIITDGMQAVMTVKVIGESDITPVKVACVGDSITYGDGVERTDNYPSFLQKKLGGKYIVENFGVNGATLLENGDNPYVYTEKYLESKAFAPNIVVIMLGTNDSKPQNWQYKDEFADNYISLIDSYKSLASKPDIYVATSPYVSKDNYDISGSVVTGEIVPLQKEIAVNTGSGLIDINLITSGKTAWYTDGVHPNSSGYEKIAGEIADTVMLPEPLRSITLNKTNSYLIRGQSETFTVSYQPAVIIETKEVTWSSDNESVAVVEDGKVTAVNVGTAVITADCHGKKASVKIEVYEEDAEIFIPLTSEEDLNAFDFYYSDDATNGYIKQYGYQPHWVITENGVERSESTLGDMKWGEYNTASMLFNRQMYRNFELSIDIHRKDVGEWQYPMVVFGIKDPEKYMLQENGGIAVFATAEGGLIVTGQVEDHINEWLGGGAPPDGSGYLRESVHTLNIRVEYNTVTVSIEGARNENLPEPVVFELGDTDMDGYIALVGKANPCGFKNFRIRALLDNDVEKLTIRKVAEKPQALEVPVGTVTDDISFPATVKVEASDGNYYNVNIRLDYDGYDRYRRGTYILKGYFEDTLFADKKVKLYGNGDYADIEVKVTGDADMVDENTVCFDFNGVSELEFFENYHSERYDIALQECDPLDTWEIVDGKLYRLRTDNFTELQTGGWTEEKSISEMSSLVYTGRKYRNFELNVDYKRGEGGFWWAMVAFAIEDPTKFITEENGGIAAYAEMEGRPLFWSYARNRSPITTPYDNFGFTDWHHMKLVVNNGIATMYLDDRTPSFSMKIPDEYADGGYISLLTNANTATFDNLSIKALPDDVVSGSEGFDASNYPELKFSGTEQTVSREWTSGIAGTGEQNISLNIISWMAAVSLGFIAADTGKRFIVRRKTEEKR